MSNVDFRPTPEELAAAKARWAEANPTELERLQRIAADIRALTSGKWSGVQMGIGNAEAMALLERQGAEETVYHYDNRPSIRRVVLQIDGVWFTAQMEVAR